MRPGRELLAEGRAAAPITVPRSAYCDRVGVPHEVAAKQVACRDGRVTYHAHIGLADWAATASALSHVRDGLLAEGHDLDRYGLCLSRAMGLPAAERSTAARETGPLLADDEWAAIAAVPVQPHLGDTMIGTPAGFETTLAALRVGATTIGNLGQYFSFSWPGRDDVELTTATVRALGAMAAKRHQGALVHSYLDDGLAMQFSHYGAYAGWAALELYVVDDLCRARLAHSFGGLVDVPAHRAILLYALDDLQSRRSIGSMVYGDTVDMTLDHTRNRAVLASSALVDIAAQLHRPTGHAVHVTPLTEAARIPSAAEILEVQLLARELEREARRSADVLAWRRIESAAADLAAYAVGFRDRALSLLEVAGVDVGDPAALLLELRRLGPAALEARVGTAPPPPIAALRPWKARLLETLAARVEAGLPRLDGVRVLLCVLEVHDVVRDALARALPRAGCEVVLLGADETPASVARAAVDEDVDAIVVGTYNGNALTVARALVASLETERWAGRIIFGGLLNEDEGGDLPVDVRDRVEALGIHTARAIEDLGSLLEGALATG
jgi:methylmalonyl-CoA mutase cobalamin-binding domain/chain